MGPGDVPKYPKEVSTKKLTLKKLNLKKLHQISENPPDMVHLCFNLWKDFISDNCCPRGAVYNSPKIRDNPIVW